MNAIWMFAGLCLLGCSSRVAVPESTESPVRPKPTFEPDAQVHAAFTCTTAQAITTARDTSDAGVVPTGGGDSERTSASSEQDCPDMQTGAGSTSQASTTVASADTNAPSTAPADGGQEVASSDTDPASTSEPCPTAGEGGGSDFECGEPCAPKLEPCTCYVEKACLNGDDDCSGVEVWSLTVDEAEFEHMNENYKEDIRIPGTLCADSKTYELTLEVQGASSRKFPKKNYNLRFDGHNELPGKYLGTEGTIDKLVVKAMATDRTLIRETLGFDLWRAMGHDAPFSGGLDGYVQLVINGQFHGLYSRVEPVDKDYLRRRGMPDDGRLYKGVRRRGAFADFRPERIIEDAFEDRTDPDHPNYELLQELIDVIQDDNLSPEEFVAEIGRYLSIDLIIDRIVWVSFTQNGDAVAQNFFLYYQPGVEPPWHLIPWDSNLCFGADWQDPENFVPPTSTFLFDGRNLLAERLLEHPPIHDAYKKRYEELLASLFTSDELTARLWPLVDYLGVAMDRDRALWGYPTDAASAFEALAEFLNTRPVAVGERVSGWL